MTKQAEYMELVAARKACHACPGLTNPADVDGGCHDSDHTGPWSQWQGSLDAKLMVIGQDWGDTTYFRANQGWDKATSPTCLTLIRLLSSIGIQIDPPGPNQTPQVFLTNAILCLKEAGMQSQPRDSWFDRCAWFLRRQVEIVSPAIVVPMGSKANRALRKAFNLPPKGLKACVEDHRGDLLPTGSMVLAVYHCGNRVLNSDRSLKQQVEDWARIERALEIGQ